MKKYKSILFTLGILALGASSASATTVLYDWGFNIDGSIYDNLMGPVDSSSFNTTTGMGTLSWSTSGVGDHSFQAFVDHDIDACLNTWFNEQGSAHGTLAAGQSFEIDEPGFFGIYGSGASGDIYANLLSGAFDNQVYNGDTSIVREDVAMGLGWEFMLAAGETAFITLTLSDEAPTDGFYLAQYDPETGMSDGAGGFLDNKYYSPETTIYYSIGLDIRSAGPGPDPVNPVPEPGTMLLFGSGLAFLGYGRTLVKKSAKKA